MSSLNKNTICVTYRILMKLIRKENESNLKLEGYFVMKTTITIPIEEIEMDVENFKNLTTENWKIEDKISSIITKKKEAENLFNNFYSI